MTVAQVVGKLGAGRVVTAGFEEDDLVAVVLRQPRRDDGAGGPGVGRADDDGAHVDALLLTW